MLLKKKNLPHSRLELIIKVDAQAFRHAFDAETDTAGADLKIEGFRPGKAPRAKIVDRIGRDRLEVAALDHALSEVYQHTLAENNIIPVEGPKIEVKSFTLPGPDTADDVEVAQFVAEVDVLPEVTIEGYKKIKVKPPKEVVVEEEEKQKVLDELRRQRATLIEAAEGTKAVKGMWLDIYFKGSIDGVAREDMQTDHHPLVLGQGNLIPGFEEELEGMKQGEEKTFKVTFPKDYHAEALRSKKAEFTVRINELKDMVLPVADDEFAKNFGLKNFKDLQETLEKNLKAEKEEGRQRELEELVLEALLKVARFEVPQSLVTQEQARLFEETKERFIRMQVDWNQYLTETGKTEDALREEVKDQAEKNVKIGLALGKVIQAEGIKGSDGQAMRQAMDNLIAIATGK